MNTDRDSAHNTRPPTYSPYTTTPPYTANEPATTSAHDLGVKREWSASFPSASSIAAAVSDAVFGHTESSLTDTVSVGESSVEVRRPAGPRYGQLQ